MSRRGKSYGVLFILYLFVGCQAPLSQSHSAKKLSQALAILESSPESPPAIERARTDYRRALADVLSELIKGSASPAFVFSSQAFRTDYAPEAFSTIAPGRQARATVPGLHRAGLGLPAIGALPASANSPRAGYHVPVTVLALPKAPADDSFAVRLTDPERVTSVHMAGREFATAMNLEAALNATRATGPRFLDGLGFLLRPDRKRSRLIFLQPYDFEKTPVVLIHGLISTPKMWAPVLKRLLADAEIRRRYQFWFFYYPTGQPVPLSALQLREALDEAIRAHGVRHRLILIGHSMGGVLARAQVSRLAPSEAEAILPRVSQLPTSSKLRRCLIFEPRKDVSRVVFICTPHQGSRLALGTLGGLATRLIRLPGWIADELADFASQALPGTSTRLPTSIHGLSPDSRFLRALTNTRPVAPSHSIIGERDFIVPLASSHFDGAASEVLVPAGHGGFAHTETLQEIVRILKTY